MDAIYFEDIEVGFVDESAELVVDRAEMIAYAERNDPWPIHIDQVAAANGPYGDVVASFGYVVSLLFRMVHGMHLTQASQASFLGAVEWRVQFRAAVRADDRLRDRATVASTRLTSKGDRGVVTIQHELLNQRDEPVIVIDVVQLNLVRP